MCEDDGRKPSRFRESQHNKTELATIAYGFMMKNIKAP